MVKILSLIENGNYNEASDAIIEEISKNGMTEQLSIYSTLLCQQIGDNEGAILSAEKGLAINNQNYELYLMMAECLEKTNPNQAYLCYENAIYFAKRNGKPEDVETIEAIFLNFKESYASEITVKPASIVILSYNTLDFTKETIRSIRDTCPKSAYELVLVDNASKDGSLLWLKSQKDIILVANTENKGFPGGCNCGIKAASPNNDIFLLNSDVTVPENALFTLRMGLYSDVKIGSAGAVTNHAANYQMIDEKRDSVEEYLELASKYNYPMENALEMKSWLVGFAMLIKRPVLEKVGYLDEIFNPGNYEDNDLGLRIALAGYLNVLCHNSFIIHYGSKSFVKDRTQIDKYGDLLGINRNKYKSKWKIDPDYFSYVRYDIASKIERDKYDKFSVLEIGCASGNTLTWIKYNYPNAIVKGYELAEIPAQMASHKFPCIQGNIEETGLPFGDEKFDYIIYADVLEHLKDPEKILLETKTRLKINGQVLISLPNVMNISVIAGLLRGDFTYQDEGILDYTHLRFFTVNEVSKMVQRLGYRFVGPVGFVGSEGMATDDYKDVYEIIKTIPGVAPKEMFDVAQIVFSITLVN